MAKNEVPGLTLAIVQAPYIPRSAGYGRASLVHDELARPAPCWRSADDSGFHRRRHPAAAGDRQARGARSDRQAPHRPPAAWSKITILDLLQHASGIPDYRTAGAFKEGQHYLPAELLGLVSGLPLEFQPGTQGRQSATGFALLGMIVEKASGMSYHDFVWSKQIAPLGLRATMFVEDFRTKAYTDRSGAPGKKQHTRFTAEAPFISPIEPATGYRAGATGLVAVDPMATANLFAFGALVVGRGHLAWDVGAGRRHPGQAAGEPRADLQADDARQRHGGAGDGRLGIHMHPGFMEIKGSAPGFSAYLSRFTDAADLVA